jgi:retinol dehydrogenase 14
LLICKTLYIFLGLVDTGIWRNVPFPFKIPFNLMTRMFFKTPEQGAQTSIYLASSPEVEGVSGKYFDDCKEAALKPCICDPEKCKILWEESLKIAKINEKDFKI